MTQLLVIVPTRNRAELAAAAVESVATSDRVRVLVSDNSTIDAQRRELADFCRKRGDPRVELTSPPQPLAMGDHWEWVLRRALATPPSDEAEWTHVCVLTDRMLFLPGAVEHLLAVTDARPGAIVAYSMDKIDDLRTPVVLEEPAWTGRLLEIPSQALLDASAQCVFADALPRLLNCCVPRAVLDEVAREFPSICAAVSPDFRFAYRSLTVTESVLYADRALLVQYALTRSNGHSHSRGKDTPDAKDFERELARTGTTYLTPLPLVRTVVNGIAHEYASVRAETARRSLAPMNAEAFFAAMTREIDAMEDEATRTALRAEVARVQVAHAAETPPPATHEPARGPVRKLLRAGVRASRRDDALGAIVRVATSPVRARFVPKKTVCADVAAAIERVRTHPRKPRSGRAMHELILRDVRVVSQD